MLVDVTVGIAPSADGFDIHNDRPTLADIQVLNRPLYTRQLA